MHAALLHISSLCLCLYSYMELKLVFRGLRQISDWALRYYSEAYVDGKENVPRDGPLIMCDTTPAATAPMSPSTTRT